MAFGSTYTTTIQDSTAITPEHISPYIYTFRPITPYLNVISGFEDVFEMIAKKQKDAPDIYRKSKQAASTLDQMNILGIPMPEKIQLLKKMQAKVIRAGSIPEIYTFQAIDYTSSATYFDLASPSRLIPKNALLQFAQDNGSVITIRTTNVVAASDGTARIYFSVVSGTLANVTNTTTAKSLRLLNAFAAQAGAVQAQDNQTASVSTFGMTKIQTVVSASTESMVTVYDTEDQVSVVTDALLPKLDSTGKQLNNSLLFNPSVTTTDSDGNSVNIAPGIVNMSGIGSTNFTTSGLGPTNLEAMIDAITQVSCLDADFYMENGRICLDVFCSRTVKVLFDQMSHRSTAPFGSQVFTKMGEDEYDLHTNKWNGLTAKLKIHHDRSFDSSTGYTNTLLMINRNAVKPIWLDKHFFRTEQSQAQSDGNKYTLTCTNIFGQVVLVPEHIQLGTAVSALET